MRPTTVTYGALRTLAALLLVDGRYLPTREIARIALPCHGSAATPRGYWIPQLRSAGCQIETMDFRGSGYRLLAIPPDELLDDVLAVSRQLQREHPTRLWELFGRPTATCQILAPRLSA